MGTTRNQGSENTSTHYGRHKESRLRLPAHIMGTTRNQGSEITGTHYGHHKESRLRDYRHTLWEPQGIKAQRLPAHIMGTTKNQGCSERSSKHIMGNKGCYDRASKYIMSTTRDCVCVWGLSLHYKCRGYLQISYQITYIP